MIDANPSVVSQTAARVAEQIRAAVAANTAHRIRGSGTWMNAGAPVAAQAAISLADDAGIVEYVPGDLTLTALAGTSLASIREATESNRQWLPLDPFGTSDGSIGATIATASYGPLAQQHGTPRDQLLGVEFVSGTGEIVRGGGRVTKNVAGFDLCRLVCGSWGTLGVITEVTMRLRGMPDADATLAVPLPASNDGLRNLLDRVAEARLTPAALEMLNTATCRAVGLDFDSGLLVRFCGNDAGVRVQTERLTNALPAVPLGQQVWDRLRCAEDESDIVVRVSARPSELPLLWEFGHALAARIGSVKAQASAGRGIMRLQIPAQHSAELANALQSRPAWSLICERLPAELWPRLAPPHPVNDRLNTRARDAFDPHRILNPGIFGGSAA